MHPSVPHSTSTGASWINEIERFVGPGTEGHNAQRVGAVEDAIRAIEAATGHPELRRIPKR
jgi:hypothetical protein